MGIRVRIILLWSAFYIIGNLDKDGDSCNNENSWKTKKAWKV